MNKLTPKQIEIGSRYLAMSNICTLDRFKDKIVDLSTLERYVHAAWEDAVMGTMEGMDGGYNDRHETKAIRLVDQEINSFKRDLKKGGKKAAFWVETLQKEVPFLFQ